MALIKKGTDRFVESHGELNTDKYGISTATATWHDQNATPTLIAIGSAHPFWSGLTCEHSTASFQGSHWKVEGQYVGILTTPAAIYELDFSVAEVPIDSHPNFVTTIGGTAASPLNGATFDATSGLFQNFGTTAPDSLRGVTAYLSPGAVWRKTIVQATSPTSIGTVGSIVTPDGSPPTPPSGRTWLYMGLNFEQRGGIYTVKSEWKLSDRLGWNTLIYT